MAELLIKVPKNLPASMIAFMGKVQQFSDFTNELQETAKETADKVEKEDVAGVRRRHDFSHQMSQLRRMGQLFNKFDQVVVRSIDEMVNSLGPIARGVARSMVVETSALDGPIADFIKRVPIASVEGGLARGVAALGPVGWILGGGYVVYKVMRWIWDKARIFGEALQQDRLASLATGVPLGGLRAMRIGFGMLPGMSEFERNLALTRGDYTSHLAMVLRRLRGGKWATFRVGDFPPEEPESERERERIMASVIELLSAARTFMTKQPKGFELLRARGAGLTDFFPPELLLALPKMSFEELTDQAAWILANQWGLAPDEKAQKDLIGFFKAEQRMWESIYNAYGQIWYDFGIPQLLTKMTEQMTRYTNDIIAPDLLHKGRILIEGIIREMEGWIIQLEDYIREIKKPLPGADNFGVEFSIKKKTVDIRHEITLQRATRAGIPAFRQLPGFGAPDRPAGAAPPSGRRIAPPAPPEEPSPRAPRVPPSGRRVEPPAGPQISPPVTPPPPVTTFPTPGIPPGGAPTVPVPPPGPAAPSQPSNRPLPSMRPTGPRAPAQPGTRRWSRLGPAPAPQPSDAPLPPRRPPGATQEYGYPYYPGAPYANPSSAPSNVPLPPYRVPTAPVTPVTREPLPRLWGGDVDVRPPVSTAGVPGMRGGPAGSGVRQSVTGPPPFQTAGVRGQRGGPSGATAYGPPRAPQFYAIQDSGRIPRPFISAKPYPPAVIGPAGRTPSGIIMPDPRTYPPVVTGPAGRIPPGITMPGTPMAPQPPRAPTIITGPRTRMPSGATVSGGPTVPSWYPYPQPTVPTGGHAITLKPDPARLVGPRVDPVSFYNNAREQFRYSPLNGYVPQDGARWGIKTGSPDEWARLATATAQQESNFNANLSGGGLLQMSNADLARHGVKGSWDDPNAQLQGLVNQWSNYIPKAGVVAAPATGPGTYSGWGGAGAYFGSLRYGPQWHGRAADVDKYLGAGGFADTIQGSAGEAPSATAMWRMPKPQAFPAGPKAGPGAILARDGGPPTAIVVHHTSTGVNSTAEGIVNGWRSDGRGIGADYIMDRDGTMHDVRKEFGYEGHGHVHPNFTPGDYKDQGLVNPRMVGVEVISPDDKSVDPRQVQAFKEWARNYPSTPLFGHGELNPIQSHREWDEGKTIIDAVNEERGLKSRVERGGHPSIEDRVPGGTTTGTQKPPELKPGVAVKDQDYQGYSPKGYRTAEQAGIKPEFPVDDHVNWQLMKAETLARMNQAYRNLSDEDKAKVNMKSGYRPTTREEARNLGMNESSSQEWLYENKRRTEAVAPPGSSRHEQGEAGDFEVNGGEAAMKRAGQELGLTGIKPKKPDPEHIQMVRDQQNRLAQEPGAKLEGPARTVPLTPFDGPHQPFEHQIDPSQARDYPRAHPIHSLKVESGDGSRSLNGHVVVQDKKPNVHPVPDKDETPMPPSKSDATGGGQIESPA